MSSCLGQRSAKVGRTPVAAALIALVLSLVLSSCIVLVQDDTFSIGTESYRANLVVYVETTAVLDAVRSEFGITVARDLVLSEAPSSFTLPAAVLAIACGSSPALCVSGSYVPNLVLSWFRSDVRNRGDFATNLAAAAGDGKCFAWTFIPSRNFTEKPVGNSGCRHD